MLDHPQPLQPESTTEARYEAPPDGGEDEEMEIGQAAQQGHDAAEGCFHRLKYGLTPGIPPVEHPGMACETHPGTCKRLTRFSFILKQQHFGKLCASKVARVRGEVTEEDGEAIAMRHEGRHAQFDAAILALGAEHQRAPTGKEILKFGLNRAQIRVEHDSDHAGSSPARHR